MKAIYNLVVKLLLSAAGLGLASLWLDGVHVDHPSTLFVAAILLAIANAFIRPVFVLLTLPVTVLSLGLFLLVINAAMLGLVAWTLDGLTFDGFWSALGAWFLIAVFNAIGTALTGKSKLVVKIERID